MYKITNNSNELYHYGVLGMKWGVRRYQNYDGTRIGTGGRPVVNRAKTAEGTVKKLKSTMDKGFRNTVPGGQGGKATGNARLAAAAGGNSSNKSEDKKSTAEIILEPSVKKGKDKANTSIAQETAKGLIRTGKATQDSINVIKNSDPKVKKAQEDNATKARKMSDQELRESINRIKMEREYVSLKNDEITTGYDKVIGIIDKAKPFLEVTAEVAGLIASILLIKSKLGHSDSDMELDNLYTYCMENDFPPDVIEHATRLDLDYILDYYNVSAEDLQHMLIDEDELYHHGILGMKWGVRRYQNYDGSRIGAGSGSGGGGGGSKSPSSSRGSIVTGQGGKAKGNARLAAGASFGELSKKNPSKEMQRDIENSSKLRIKIKNARDKHVKDSGLILPSGATSLSTGKHYDAALDKASEDWQKNGNTYADEYKKLEKDTDAFMEKYTRGEATQKELNDLLIRGRKLDEAYEKEAKRVITAHQDDLNAATLRDLGYDEEHVNAGVEYLRKKNKQIFEYVI